MWVMLCRENTYELTTDPTYEPDLSGVERTIPARTLAEWKPDVIQF